MSVCHHHPLHSLLTYLPLDLSHLVRWEAPSLLIASLGTEVSRVLLECGFGSRGATSEVILASLALSVVGLLPSVLCVQKPY